MNINWFPGHMLKTKRQIKEYVNKVDAVIEIRDARIPRASANPDIIEICSNKPRIILLNKYDLADEKATAIWSKFLKQESDGQVEVLPVNCVNSKGLNAIKPAVNKMLEEKLERMKNKGVENFRVRIMVVGIPNAGKSSFINKIAKNNTAKTGDRPGVTKSKQWIRTSMGMDLMDTPGVLWPKFEDQRVALNLAFTGAIKDEIMDMETLAVRLVERLSINYADNLMARYKLTELSEDPVEIIDNIARKRGMILRGNNIDYERVCSVILDEYRSGLIGKITLEMPDDDLTNPEENLNKEDNEYDN